MSNAAPATDAPATDASATARAAGRGGVAVLGAKVFFILSGFIQNLALPAFIGQADFGALARVLAVANVVNNVMVSSATQGVSRMVARARSHGDEALRVGLRVHGVIAVAVGILFVLAAPAVGAFEHAPYIVLPLATMAGVATCYGFYAALVGALNGRAQFSKQAALDVTFAVLRTVGMLGAGWLFLHAGHSGDLGAALGFVTAAILIVPLALRWTGIGRAAHGPIEGVPPVRTYLVTLVPLAVAQLFTNAVMQIDISLLGRFLSESAPTRKAADEWVAIYRECQLFAFLPYQLLFSVTQVLFPFVARAHAEGDASLVASYVARGARIGAIVCGLLVAVVAGMPGSLLRFAFSADVATAGGDTLRILALGQGAFAMLGLASTVLVSLGRERESAVITAITLGVIGAGCYGFVPTSAFGSAQIAATAMATGIGLSVGFVLAAARVRQVAGAFIPWKTGARVAFAVAAVTLIGTRLPRVGRFVAPVEAIAVALVYVVLLVATGELGRADAKLATTLVGRKGA